MTKPHIICHMCTSIDGKILADRWPHVPGLRGVGGLYETTGDSFGISAWLVGTKTMTEFAGKKVRLRAPKQPVPRGDFLANLSTDSFAIGTDAKGTLRFQSGDVDGDHVVILTVNNVGEDYLAHLRSAGVSYLLCGKDSLDLRLAMDKLRRLLGIKKLLLEGGGTFNGAMLAAGLVDEISQVIVPIVDGGAGVTGIFEVPGKPAKKAIAALRTMAHKKLSGGATWLRYRVARGT